MTQLIPAKCVVVMPDCVLINALTCLAREHIQGCTDRFNRSDLSAVHGTTLCCCIFLAQQNSAVMQVSRNLLLKLLTMQD